MRLRAEVPQLPRAWLGRGWPLSQQSRVWIGCGQPLRLSALFSLLRHRCETTKPATQGRTNGDAPRASLMLTTQTTSSQPCCLIASVRVSIISRTARACVRGGAADLGRWCAQCTACAQVHSVEQCRRGDG